MVKLKLAATAAQVKPVCDLLHQYEPMEKRQLQRIQKDGFYRGFARSILDGDKPQLGGYVFDLVQFRSIDGSDLPSILPVSRKIVIKRKLRAFVGHRFNRVRLRKGVSERAKICKKSLFYMLSEKVTALASGAKSDLSMRATCSIEER